MSKHRATVSRLERILIIPDTHAPYHNPRHWRLMLKAAHGFRPDRIIHMGDLIDFYAISQYSKDPIRLQRTRVKDELRVTNLLLDDLDRLGAVNKHLLAGNHEDRWIRYLHQSAPELVDVAGLSLPELLGVQRRGWDFRPYRTELKVGKVFYTHEIGNCGQTAHIVARRKYQANAILGHTHHMGLSYEGNAKGEIHVGGVFGWLGNVDAIDYVHRILALQWVPGFGVGYMDSHGVTHLQAVPIIKSRCVVGGVMYSL